MKIKIAFFNGVASIELADIAKKNAFNDDTYAQMAQAIKLATDIKEVRALLIHGQPDVFSVGNELESLTQSDFKQESLPFKAFADALMTCDKPIIAAVNGVALGSACSMLLHCDFVYAADTAQFAFSFASLGLVPDFATSYLLPLKVGQAKANEMLLLAQPFGAQDALDAGFVNLVLPAKEVLNYARAIAERFNIANSINFGYT
ncbi:MAG: enoyl-CoA hydratase-related protein [Saezia sp.]